MKTLGKLNLNPDRILKDKELLKFSGGGSCRCFTNDYQTYIGSCGAYDFDSCMSCCQTLLGQYGSVEWIWEG